VTAATFERTLNSLVQSEPGMVDLVALRDANARRWAAARPIRNFASVARALVEPNAKQRYKILAARTGVPWWFIAVVHERESSQSWKGSLAQGDPWDHVSVHVPAGRGPFNSWEDAAADALVNCAPFAARNTDWSIGRALTLLEEYNGLGYAMRGDPSPYVWSGTDQYKSGKYIRDGVFDPNVIDTQLGCAGLLMAMMAIDKSISLTGTPPPAPKPTPVPAPSVTQPAKGSIGAAIASLILRILSFFKRK
jgi:lysozyme family protein